MQNGIIIIQETVAGGMFVIQMCLDTLRVNEDTLGKNKELNRYPYSHTWRDLRNGSQST